MKKIWKYLLLIVITVCLQQTVIAQTNLVQNGSFEQQYSCPSSTSQVDTCIGWHRVRNTPYDYCSPDYFDTCAPYPVSIPDNLCGSQLPFEGHAYVGLYTYHWSYFYREIIMTQLTDSLIVGSTYHISMRVSRGNWTNMAYNCSASNKLGMRFTTYAYSPVDTPAIDNYAQVYTDSIIEDTLNWVLLEWNYVPDSAYTHVYIGNFFDDISTDTTVIAAPIGQFGSAYYFIDSISITCISSNCFTGLNEENKDEEIFFDAGILNIKVPVGRQYILEIYNETGQSILRREIRGSESINISQFSPGFYAVCLRSKEKTAFKKIIKF